MKKLHAHNITALDPLTCDSWVSYTISSSEWENHDKTVQKNLNAEVHLTDCNRKISWYFSEDSDETKAIDALNKVIDLLDELRREYRKAQIELGL